VAVRQRAAVHPAGSGGSGLAAAESEPSAKT
jgi:hypothetical protein